MNQLKAFWTVIRQQWLTIAVIAIALQASYQMYDNLVLEAQKESENKRLTTERTNSAIDQIKNKTDESLEFIACLAIESGADKQMVIAKLGGYDELYCLSLLRGTNNLDGTFLSNGSSTINRQQPNPQPTAQDGGNSGTTPNGNVNNNDNQALVERCLLIACLKIERP